MTPVVHLSREAGACRSISWCGLVLDPSSTYKKAKSYHVVNKLKYKFVVVVI